MRSHRGHFQPENPEKYTGTYPIVWRSSWELAVCRLLDNHPDVVRWASESMKIPYFNPIQNKYTVYVPDFTALYKDKTGKLRAEILEVKPKRETLLSEAKTKRDKAALQVNAIKWKAAKDFADKHGMFFRVLNEDHIFSNQMKRKR